MSASSHRPRRLGPTPIDSGAVENLQYIRRTIEAAHTFTTVPGKGCIAMGVTALAAVAAESYPPLAVHWLAIWVGAAAVACALALWFMEKKAHAQGLSLRRSVAKRFFMTLAPAFLTGAILTAALVGRVDRELITATWLLLYGTGLTTCGLFAVPAVFTAGVAFMALGAATLWLPPGSAHVVLALGFGGIHLALGAAILRHHGG
ncbi:MAG TPA: hypothetical protein VHH11_09160 [Gammaproteobacteria bacterium]|jgi:hypothetical protein|nr:hypothetical protein [Gammaproteobacteria bacterium]